VRNIIFLLILSCVASVNQTFAQAIYIDSKFRPFSVEEWARIYESRVLFLEKMLYVIDDILSKGNIDEILRTQFIQQRSKLITCYNNGLLNERVFKEVESIDKETVKQFEDFIKRISTTQMTQKSTTTSSNSQRTNASSSNTSLYQNNSKKSSAFAITKRNTPLYSSPGKTKKITTISKNCTVEILLRYENYYRVRIRHLDGFIREKDLIL
jgi:hypothetical protein